MKERPILFSGAMVRAILAGTKSQTRRIVKPQPQWGCIDDAPELGDGFIWWPRGKKHERWNNPCDENTLRHGMAASPFAYARIGQRLWVKETWQPIWKTDMRPRTPEGWSIGYVATDGVQEYHDDDLGLTTRCKPSIFMPRWASRITLEVTGVRVERLHAITEEDARAEGVDECDGELDAGDICRAAKFFPDCGHEDARSWFGALWAGINDWDSLAENPWLWCISFRRIEAAARAA